MGERPACFETWCERRDGLAAFIGGFRQVREYCFERVFNFVRSHPSASAATPPNPIIGDFLMVVTKSCEASSFVLAADVM